MYAVFDTETDEWKNEMRTGDCIKFLHACCIVYDNNKEICRFHEFNEVLFCERLISICEKHKIKRIYAHFLKFDIRFLMHVLSERFELKIIQNAGNVYSVKCIKNKRILFEFRDSYCILHNKIVALGNMFNLAKMSTDNRSVEYCYRDCEIAALSLQKIVEFLNTKMQYPCSIETLKLTSSSIAFDLMLKNNSIFDYIDENKRVKNKIVSVNKFQNEFFRGYYFGGRCECFDFNLAESCYVFDKNSLFPFVMSSTEFPIPPYTITTNYSNESIDYFMQYEILAFAFICDVDESNMQIPLVPERVGGKVLFRACKKNDVLLFREEITFLKEHKCEIVVKKAIYCDSYYRIFSYIEKLYEERQKLKKLKDPFEHFYKIFMNGSYGKLAESIEKNETIFMRNDDVSAETIESLQKLGFIMQNSMSDEIVYFAKKNSVAYLRLNVIIACMITAIARLEITKCIYYAIEHDAKVFYVDTDSIFTDKNIFENTNILGQMKLEYELKNFQALGAKEYISESVKKIKGLHNRNDDEHLDDEDVIRYLSNEQNCSVRPAGLFESFKRHIDMRSVVSVDKHKRNYYDKRIINSDLTTRAITEHDNVATNESIFSTIVDSTLQRLLKSDDERLQRIYQRSAELELMKNRRKTKQKTYSNEILSREKQYVILMNEFKDLYDDFTAQDIDDRLTVNENAEMLRERIKSELIFY